MLRVGSYYHSDDVFSLLAWLFMVICLVIATLANPLLYQVSAVIVGEVPPPPSMEDLEEKMITLRRWNVAAQTLFWTSLYCVKLAFLFFYRLLIANDAKYKRVWLGGVVYVVVCYGLCLVGVFGQCGDVRNLFKMGELTILSDFLEWHPSYVFVVLTKTNCVCVMHYKRSVPRRMSLHLHPR